MMDSFVKLIRNHPHVLYSAKFYEFEVREINLTNIEYNDITWDWDDAF